MKKIFTLFAGFCLFASGAFAQEKWTNLVLNGSMEGEADPMWSSFWCHDYRTPEEVGEIAEGSGQQWDDVGQFQGFAEIVEDPDIPGNHCARVKVRSQAEAEEAGNMVADNGNMAGWDTQFFIYLTEPLPSGKQLRLTMKIKADKEGPNPGTQAHYEPGNYNHWAMVGNPSFTTEWKVFEWEGTISADQAGESNEKQFQSIAFNLADFKDGYVAYFDDIKVEVRDKPEPNEFSGWFNFLRKGTMTNDPQQNYTTFTGRDGAVGQDLPARIVDDPIDGQPALCVTTIAYDEYNEETSEVPMVDSETGEPVVDPDTGEPMMELVTVTTRSFTDANGTHRGVSNGDSNEWTSSELLDWQTQFFVTVPHKFVAEQPYKLRMWARADSDITIDTQAHTMPGAYVHYNFCGSLNLTPDWQEFIFGDDETPATIISEANGCQTIAFNCNKEKYTPVNIYFRFDEFSFNEADVEDNERVLGSSTTSLPVGATADSEIKASIDVSEALEVLEVDRVTDFDVAVQGEEVFSTIGEGKDNLSFDVGIFIDQNGFWTLSEEIPAVDLELDDTKQNVDVLNLNVINMNGIALEPGKGIDTKIAFQNSDGWRYLYNVTLLDEGTYTAIEGVETAPVAKKGVIYDLMGRKTTTPVKGLYIKDGKKYLVK